MAAVIAGGRGLLDLRRSGPLRGLALPAPVAPEGPVDTHPVSASITGIRPASRCPSGVQALISRECLNRPESARIRRDSSGRARAPSSMNSLQIAISARIELTFVVQAVVGSSPIAHLS